MNILSDTSGEFVFIIKEDDKYKQVTFDNIKDIPDDFDFEHVIKFSGNIPEPPHTLQQHEEMSEWNRVFQNFIEKENARRNQNR